MTKDEIIFNEACRLSTNEMSGHPSDTVILACAHGAHFAYDHHRQEIDELREQVKWWASKWVQISKKNSENEDYLELNALYDFRLELDAAAARVMGK